MAARQPVSPTGYAVLGLLSFGRHLTGYELKQWADQSLRFFYDAPAMSQVYTELDRLERAALVRSVERPDGARAVRVFSLTSRGRAELKRWVASDVEAPQLKHHLALRVFLGHLADPERLVELIEQQRATCEAIVTDLDAVRTDLGDDPDGTWRHARLVADWGLDYYRAEIRALERLADRLSAAHRR